MATHIYMADFFFKSPVKDKIIQILLKYKPCSFEEAFPRTSQNKTTSFLCFTFQNPHYKLKERAQISNDSVYVIAESKFFKFKDDVCFSFSDEKIRATSCSRIGQGDMGQNKRNIYAIINQLDSDYRVEELIK